MQIWIPQKLQPYVRMSPKSGLVPRSNMPPELQPLFEETRKKVEQSEQAYQKSLEDLIK